MASKPAWSERPWDQTLILRWIGEVVRMVALSLLCGFLIGVGVVLANLTDFSYLPDFVGYLVSLVAGVILGLLTRHLSQTLIAALLTTGVSAVVATLALAYPESQANRLGMDTAVQLSVLKGLTDSFFTVPFTLVGLLAGKWLARSD